MEDELLNEAPEVMLDELAHRLKKALETVRVDVATAPDPRTALELLGAGVEGKAVAVLFYESDSPDEDVDVDGGCLVNAMVTVGVVSHPGMRIDRGKVVKGALAIANKVRAAMTKIEIKFGNPKYAGMRPIRNAEGSLLGGYAVSFTVKTAYDE